MTRPTTDHTEGAPSARTGDHDGADTRHHVLTATPPPEVNDDTGKGFRRHPFGRPGLFRRIVRR